MDPELQKYIKDTPIYRATVPPVADILPATDAALDALITEIVQDCDARAWHFVIPAALHRGRSIDARHLARGTMLFALYDWIMALASRFTGDVASNLMTAIQQTQLSHENEAGALWTMWLWCERNPGNPLPEGFLPAARHLARRADWERHATLFLYALAKRMNDESLLSLLKQSFKDSHEWWGRIERSTTSLSEKFVILYERDVLEVLTEKPSNVLAQGRTFRRAAARVGRNEPCPCGSGKKYKHCCVEKDEARLLRSSSVAGLTHEELRLEREQHLTAALLDKTSTHEMARLDPLKIPPDLREPYLMRLCFFQLYDEAAVAFQKLGFPAELKDTWSNILYFATRAGRKESARRLLAVYPDQSKIEEEMYTSTGLLLAEDDPVKAVKLLEEFSLDTLKDDEDLEVARGFAYALMATRFRALGILVARGVIPRLAPKVAAETLNEMLLARDRLNLPPDEPVSDIVDKLLTESGDKTKDAEELRKSQNLLEIKAQEVRELKDTLERLQKEVLRREKAEAAKTPAAPSHIVPLPGNDAALKEMRRKMDELKSELKDRHNERNELRRQLQKTQSDLEALHKQSAPPPAETASQADVEDNLLLPQEAPELQPVRLIDFPKSFSQRLAEYPRRVSQAAMVMIGRLAAGEPAAYVGALRLKAVPNTMRQRIGSDYRLLFRLAPDRLEVIDLINRKDLERRIRTLA